MIGNNIHAPELIQKVVGSEISASPAADVKDLFDAGRNSEVVKASRGLEICAFIPFSNPFAEGSVEPSTFEYAQKNHSSMIATKKIHRTLDVVQWCSERQRGQCNMDNHCCTS